MSVVTAHQTDLTTFCKFKREHKLRRALHLLLNQNFPCPSDMPKAVLFASLHASVAHSGVILHAPVRHTRAASI